jgi:pyruvate dehydrogenase E2 component (dihydrolipoamide acetyltransferase)
LDETPLKLSPRARRVAQELGIALSELTALGKSTVHEEDVRALFSRRGAAPAAEEASRVEDGEESPGTPAEEPRPGSLDEPAATTDDRRPTTGDGVAQEAPPLAEPDEPVTADASPAASAEPATADAAEPTEYAQFASVTDERSGVERDLRWAADEAPSAAEDGPGTSSPPDAAAETAPELDLAPAEQDETAPDDFEALVEGTTETAPGDEQRPDEPHSAAVEERPEALPDAADLDTPQPASSVTEDLDTRAPEAPPPAAMDSAARFADTRPEDEAPAVPGRTPEPVADEEVLPITPIRRIIADRAALSAREVPQFSLWIDVDAGPLLAAAGEPLQATALWVWAVARALRAHRRLNASYTPEAIRLHASIHVGVTLPLEDGIVVPVLHDADRKPIKELAEELRDREDRAQTRRLRGEHLLGATFTLSDWSAFGIRGGLPLIHPPQVATLGIGAPRDVPVLSDGGLLFRRASEIVLVADQRALDAAHAAAFLNTLKAEVEGIQGR